MTSAVDGFKRPLRDLRISVTDRCNFRCGYCMPVHLSYKFLARPHLLTFEEIASLAEIFVDSGVEKLRLTGGEPLMRHELPLLVEMLAGVSGVKDLALTTNGQLLSAHAKDLFDAGLHRITVSVDALDPARFAEMTGGKGRLSSVLKGIEAARQAGLKIKINAVIQKGVNECEILPMAKFFKKEGLILRFIEYMDVGTLNRWNLDHVVSAEEILNRLKQVFDLKPLTPNYLGETARRYAYSDGGEVGVIASITKPFCGACNRARLSCDGKLFTCLFGQTGYDLKTPLRKGASDLEMKQLINGVWSKRVDRYSEERAEETSQTSTTGSKVEMFRIGG